MREKESASDFKKFQHIQEHFPRWARLISIAGRLPVLNALGFSVEKTPSRLDSRHHNAHSALKPPEWERVDFAHNTSAHSLFSIVHAEHFFQPLSAVFCTRTAAPFCIAFLWLKCFSAATAAAAAAAAAAFIVCEIVKRAASVVVCIKHGHTACKISLFASAHGRRGKTLNCLLLKCGRCEFCLETTRAGSFVPWNMYFNNNAPRVHGSSTAPHPELLINIPGIIILHCAATPGIVNRAATQRLFHVSLAATGFIFPNHSSYVRCFVPCVIRLVNATNVYI